MNDMRKLMETVKQLYENDEEWSTDYDSDEGITAVCPRCGSDDVSIDLMPNVKTSISQLSCENCGHKEKIKLSN